jgi:pimeloyl-ACP methyl ester carboxylesterase
MDAVLYIHGRGGSAAEAEHYKQLFPVCDVIGIEYKSDTPWKAGKEIHDELNILNSDYDRVILIANSIGAFFAMNASIEKNIAHAYFISPIVDMEKLIIGMMEWAGVTETELRERERIHTDFGEDLSWEYLSYVREHPLMWNVPTDILYGSEDNLTSIDTITAFSHAHHASLTIMDGGEHWFHTDEQMQFLDNWIRSKSDS